MTGARHGRILRGRKKEHAVGTEYFPWRPRSLPAASEFPSHSWESESSVHEQGEPGRGPSRIALPPRPRGPLPGWLPGLPRPRGTKGHGTPISAPKMQQDRQFTAPGAYPRCSHQQPLLQGPVRLFRTWENSSETRHGRGAVMGGCGGGSPRRQSSLTPGRAGETLGLF